jgi:hypothetical protein
MAAIAKIAALLALLALAATSALAAGGSGEHDSAASATIRAASDNLSISNSLSGAAILNAGNLAPGGQVTGTVTIGNGGNIAGDFSLAPSNLSDTPGPNGGVLSQALELTVQNLSTGATVYSGGMSDFGPRSLGTWQPGQSSTYKFTATLPDTGIPPSPTTGDNLYSGSSSSLQFNWNATGEGRGGGGGSPFTLKLAGRSQKLRKGSINWTANCSAACTLKTSGTVTKQKKRGKPKKLFGVRIKSVDLRSTASTTVRIKLSKQQVKKVKKALKKRYKVALVVRATATTAGGATTTGATTIQIKR